MMGLEKMLASMIGLTPEQLQAFIKGLSGAADSAVNRLASLEEKMDKVIAILERLENVGTNNSNSDGNPGTDN